MFKKCSIVLFFIFLLCTTGIAFGQTPLEKGIEEFKNENYEEALDLLLEARSLDPTSSKIAYYIGITYKKTENYKEAIPYLRDALTLPPHIKDAVLEIADALYQVENFDEAMKWIEVGEKEGIEPARLNFLKGLVLSKSGKDAEAIASFEKAKEQDKSLAQSVEFQIANIYMKQGKWKESHKRLQTAITMEPTTDIATYARDYEKVVSEKVERERPWRFSVGLSYKYDTNVIAKPETGPVADAVSGQEDTAMSLAVRVGYTAPFSFKGPFTLSAQYSLYADRYFRRDDYNMVNQIFNLTPGYMFERFALSLPLYLGYTFWQRDKGTDFLNNTINWFEDTKYMVAKGANPTVRFLVSQNNIAELTFGYTEKRYFTPPVTPDEDRDGRNISGTLGWMYSFKGGKGLLNVLYKYAEEDTSGRNWSYKENKFTANLLYPLVNKFNLQLTGDADMFEYKYINTVYDVQRRDGIYTGSIGLIYNLFKNTDIIAQYTYTDAYSNINAYDYKKQVISAGIEYRY